MRAMQVQLLLCLVLEPTTRLQDPMAKPLLLLPRVRKSKRC